MSTQDFRGGVEELIDVLQHFRRAISTRESQLNPLQHLLASRVMRAIDEGVVILDSECFRRGLDAPASVNYVSDAFVVNALEPDLNREENSTLRWLLVAYWVMLCNFEGICSNVEALVASDLNELTWLVGGALWVQWESGQPTTHELRAALVRVRERHPGFDAHLVSVLADAQGATRDAASIAQRLLADPSATLQGRDARATPA
jgi:hypothetical protein